MRSRKAGPLQTRAPIAEDPRRGMRLREFLLYPSSLACALALLGVGPVQRPKKTRRNLIFTHDSRSRQRGASYFCFVFVWPLEARQGQQQLSAAVHTIMTMANISRHVARAVFNVRALISPGVPSFTVRALSDEGWQGGETGGWGGGGAGGAARRSGLGGGGDRGMMRGSDRPPRRVIERRLGDW